MYHFVAIYLCSLSVAMCEHYMKNETFPVSLGLPIKACGRLAKIV